MTAVRVTARPATSRNVGDRRRSTSVPVLFVLRRILLDGLPHHVVELAFDLGRVALYFPGDGPPDQGAGAGIAQIDDQRAFGERHPHHARSPSAPTGRIGFRLGAPDRAERVTDIEVGPARWHKQEALRTQISLDIGVEPLANQFAIERWIPAVQAAIADGERFEL